ncbi:hypothetical protein KUCAC02_031744 [Chaenocephalus aceratus]|nr:hypothetical protein KUCAC02_031744 [Chaenocephalus aceratus]
MSLTASGFVVFLLSMPVVQGQDGWAVTCTPTEICAVKGSTVEISCTYTYPPTWKHHAITVEKTFWFTKQKGGEPVDLTTDSEYAGRVEDHCANNICTLRIKDLTESDSTEYKFRFETNHEDGIYSASPGVTLSVPDLQVQVRRLYDTGAELKCQSSCPIPGYPSYSWEFKNDSEYHQDDSGGLDSDSCVSPESVTRKKKALRSTTETHEPEEIELDSDPEYENDSHTAAQTEDTEEQEDMV